MPTLPRSRPAPETPDAPAAPAEIAARLRLSATRLARQLRQEAGAGLTPSQLSALAVIANHGPLTLGALADHERGAPPSITKVATKLVAQTLLVLRLTDSGFALGGLAVAQFGPVLVLGAFAGLVADRSDKRRLLLLVQTLAMVQSFCLAALAFMGHPPLAAIYAVALAGGFAIAFDNPARRSFVVELVPRDGINNAVSLNSALMTGSRVVGPALAGLLVTTVGF